MDTKAIEQQLRAEGFARTYLWQDGPHAFYPDHTHPTETAHIILEGQMTLVSEGQSITYGPGYRVDVPAETIHSARMGPSGCRYFIGER